MWVLFYVPGVVAKSFFDLSNGEVNYDGHTNPLLSIKVTELVDGLFIGCSMNHVIVDGTSFWHFWNMWSEIHRSNKRDQSQSLSLISCKAPTHKRWVPQGYNVNSDVFLPYIHQDEFITRFIPPQDIKWRFFHFTPEAIVALKAKANKENNNQAHISSFQALLALVWRSVVRAKGLARDQVTHCKLAANNRSRLDPPLPQEYFGNSLGLVMATTTVSELLDHGLGWAANLLNQAVSSYKDKNVRDNMKSWFKSPVVYQLSSVFDTMANSTVQVGSSPRFDLYGNEFAEVGKPVAVRSGYANKFGGKVIVFPGREGKGSVDAEICLPVDTMSALECDEEFKGALSLPVGNN